MGEKLWTIKKHLESYGSIWLDYDGYESTRPCPMTLKQANYLAARWGGYVSDLPQAARSLD